MFHSKEEYKLGVNECKRVEKRRDGIELRRAPEVTFDLSTVVEWEPERSMVLVLNLFGEKF